MGCLSVRFTPDGSHLIVAEGNNNRVTILTSACVFVRFLGVQALRWPRDAVCGPDGSVIIADADHNRICVYPFQGAEEMTESFGEKGDTVEGATFGDIAAFAVHRRRLYVLDEEHCRVKVLE